MGENFLWEVKDLAAVLRSECLFLNRGVNAMEVEEVKLILEYFFFLSGVELDEAEADEFKRELLMGAKATLLEVKDIKGLVVVGVVGKDRKNSATEK